MGWVSTFQPFLPFEPTSSHHPTAVTAVRHLWGGHEASVEHPGGHAFEAPQSHQWGAAEGDRNGEKSPVFVSLESDISLS